MTVLSCLVRKKQSRTAWMSVNTRLYGSKTFPLYARHFYMQWWAQSRLLTISFTTTAEDQRTFLPFCPRTDTLADLLGIAWPYGAITVSWPRWPKLQSLTTIKAVVYSRLGLCPSSSSSSSHTSAAFCMNSSKLSSLVVRRPTGTAVWQTSSKYNVMLDSGPLSQWYENTTLSTKPGVFNVSKCRQRSWPKAKASKKFGEVRPCGFPVMRADSQNKRDKETDKFVTILRRRSKSMS